MCPSTTLPLACSVHAVQHSRPNPLRHIKRGPITQLACPAVRKVMRHKPVRQSLRPGQSNGLSALPPHYPQALQTRTDSVRPPMYITHPATHIQPFILPQGADLQHHCSTTAAPLLPSAAAAWRSCRAPPGARAPPAGATRRRGTVRAAGLRRSSGCSLWHKGERRVDMRGEHEETEDATTGALVLHSS